MSKFKLDDVPAGYNLSKINSNFEKIEKELNEKVLYRDNPSGEPNQMESDLDMNSHRILNLPEPLNENEPARLKDVQNAIGNTSANLVSFTPYKLLTSTNVQGAIQDLYEKGEEDVSLIRDDLSDESDPLKGAALIGYMGRPLDQRLNEVYYVDDFSAATDALLLIAAIQHVDSKGGGKLVITPRDYIIDQTIQPGILSSNIHIEFQPGAKLIADTGLSTPVMDLRASNTTVTDLSLIISYPSIDCSDGFAAGASQNCTAISAQYWKQFTVIGPDLYGGEDPNNTNADSGITPICCESFYAGGGGRIRGFSDGGIYIGGDNTPGLVGDGITATIDGILFERCFQGVVAKRDLSLLRVINNTFVENVAGVVAAEIVSPNYTNPVRRLDVVGNRFFRHVSNVTRYRGPTKGLFANNIIEDWGFEYDGVTPVPTSTYALVLQGATGVDVRDNEFKRNLWAANDQRAILLSNVTLDGVLFVHGKNYFSGNSYRNLPRVLVEADVGEPSTYLNEYYQNISVGKFANLNPDSIVTYREDGSSRLWIFVGGTLQPLERGPLETQTTNRTLTNLESGGQYSNAGATGPVVITLPSASLGLTFTFRCMAAQQLQIQAGAGDIIRIGSGQSTAAGTATVTGAGPSLKLTAVDSTNWVADYSTGTWALA